MSNFVVESIHIGQIFDFKKFTVQLFFKRYFCALEIHRRICFRFKLVYRKIIVVNLLKYFRLLLSQSGLQLAQIRISLSWVSHLFREQKCLILQGFFFNRFLIKIQDILCPYSFFNLKYLLFQMYEVVLKKSVHHDLIYFINFLVFHKLQCCLDQFQLLPYHILLFWFAKLILSGELLNQVLEFQNKECTSSFQVGGVDLEN